jgi:hypothetical protein
VVATVDIPEVDIPEVDIISTSAVPRDRWR